ncbi:MAG: hypothetical protein J1F43_07080 [Muribaculaceae bacterium]|nr:hypothetical protein [Muribaculaceae bacterium]
MKLFTKLMISLAMGGAVISTTSTMNAGNPTIYGVFGQSSPMSISKFQAESPTSITPIYTSYSLDPYLTGGVFVDNSVIWYSYSMFSGVSRKGFSSDDIDSKTWVSDPTVSGIPATTRHSALALFRPANEVYGCFYNEDGSTFYFGKLNLEDNTTEKICELESQAYSLAISDLGVVYWMDADGMLHEGNLTGNFQNKIQLNIKPYTSTKYSCGSVVDPEDGTLYISYRKDSSTDCFGVVNLENGEVSVSILPTANKMANILHIPVAPPTDNSPAAISNINVTAENFSTKLNVSFTLPNQTVGGTSLSGNLKVYVAVNGEMKVNGESGTPGSAFSKEINVNDGSCMIVAYVTSSDGSEKSPLITTTYFAGQDRPQAVGNLSATKVANGVKLSWTAPEKGVNNGDFDKSSLKYKITKLANDKGETEEVLEENYTSTEYIYTLDNDDLRFLQFEITPFTNSVTGIEAKTDVVIMGEDVPGEVSNLTAVKNGKKITITWEAPTTGMNGGDYDTSSLKYKVVLLPNTELVAGTTETEYEFNVVSEIIATYKFAVTPLTDKGIGKEAQTAGISAGDYYGIPYFEDFNGKTLEETGFIVFDLNNDNSTWSIINEKLRYYYNSSNAGDDWAISAPIKMAKGKYNITFNVSTGSDSGEKLSVWIGKGQTVEAMQTVIMAEKSYKSYDNVNEDLTFNIEEEGFYNIGFYACSPKYLYYLYVDNISIEPVPTVVPSRPTILSASASSDNNSGIFKFALPTTDAEGGSFPKVQSATVKFDDEEIKVCDSNTFGWEDGEISVIWNAPADWRDGISEGIHTYSVIATNAVGDSEPAEIKVRAGDPKSKPAKASTLVADWDDATNDVTLTFTVPDACEDEDILPKISSATISLNDVELETVNENITEGEETIYLHKNVTFQNGANVYAVHFSNAAGDSEKTFADPIMFSLIVNDNVIKGGFSIVDGGLSVKGFDARVYNLAGQLIGIARDGEVLSLNPGIYVIKGDDFATKIVVR